MLDCVYNIVIGPLLMLYKYVFVAIYRISLNPIHSLLGLSLIVSFITLPMYNRADAYQKEDSEKRRSMEKSLSHIKKTFRGEERYYMTQEYYRSQNYKPIYSIKGSLSLLIQIPFFIAAYNYISNLRGIDSPLFTGPDGLVSIGKLTINMLPIVMTIINLISGIIYSHGMKWREKWQIFVLPLVFLVLLYNSCAALVLYWTFNNIFSLVKNIVIKSGRSKAVMKAVGMIIYLAGMVLFVYYVIDTVTAFYDTESTMVYIITILMSVYFYLSPLIIVKMKKKREISEIDGGSVLRVVTVEIAFVVLLALYIPYNVFSSAPEEIFGYNLNNVGILTLYCACIFIGVFLVWGNVVYYLLPSDNKNKYEKILMTAFVVTLLNFFVFKTDLGVINELFTFDGGYKTKWFYILLSIVSMFIITLLSAAVVRKYTSIVWKAVVMIIVSMLLITALNVRKTIDGIKDYEKRILANNEGENEEKILTLSKEGKNVVVIMLDRAIGAYVPFIFDEKPELLESYDGFVYYPNSVSLSKNTYTGAQALFGGYEYNPRELENSDKSLYEKGEESICVLPLIFSEKGYRTDVVDLPVNSVTKYPDMSFFDEYEEINGHSLSDTYSYMISGELPNVKKANMVSFTVMKAAPVFAQYFLYDDGSYFNEYNGLIGSVVSKPTYRDYHILEKMKDVTKIDNGNTNYYISFVSELPHAPTELQLPDYTPTDNVNNEGFNLYSDRTVNGITIHMNEKAQYKHYCVNMASFILLARWLDYLKENDVYDNTRIIIASDHGYELGQFDELVVDSRVDGEQFNCLMMYKDFNSKGFVTDDRFMCNADVPWLAVKELFNRPVNPLTGNIIDESNREGVSYDVLIKGVVGEDNVLYYNVHDNIFDRNNWTRVD